MPLVAEAGQVETSSTARMKEQLLAGLTPQQRDVIHARYKITFSDRGTILRKKMTRHEVAVILGGRFTAMRVDVLERKALATLAGKVHIA